MRPLRRGGSRAGLVTPVGPVRHRGGRWLERRSPLVALLLPTYSHHTPASIHPQPSSRSIQYNGKPPPSAANRSCDLESCPLLRSVAKRRRTGPVAWFGARPQKSAGYERVALRTVLIELALQRPTTHLLRGRLFRASPSLSSSPRC